MLRILMVSLSALFLTLPATALTGRPEIVVIVDDDVSAHSMGAYGEPEAVSTPNFDSLAAAGQLYLNASSSSMCSPTRRNIYYGETELQHGVGSAISLEEELLLPPVDRPSVVQGLQSMGYRVVLVGKFHAGEGVPNAPEATSPAAMGWDDVRALMQGNPRSTFPEAIGSPHPLKNHHYYWIQSDWQTGLGGIQTGYTTDVMTAEAVAVLQDADPRPLALFVMYSAPHFPMNPPPGEVGGCAPTNYADDPSCYDPAIEYIDTKLADIMAELDWSEDLLIKTSDNGRPPTFSGATEYCNNINSKAYATPCGTRVPLVVRGKGVTSGTVSAPVNLTDIHDTLLDLAGALQTGVESISFKSCFSNPVGCAPRAISGSIRFDPDGFPLAMYSGSAYSRYQISLNTIVGGNLYWLLREWDEFPSGNDPGPFTDLLFDLGSASIIDRTRRYGQVFVSTPSGDAATALLAMQAEADRLEATTSHPPVIPLADSLARVVLSMGMLALGLRSIRSTLRFGRRQW
jgi:hypothetical protein